MEGSDRADFERTDTLFLIKEPPYRLHTVARLSSDRPYRYMRYKGADGCFCNISELAFYKNMEDSIPLYGKVMGTPGSFGDNTHEYWNAFDGNPNTSFDYIHPDGGWTGLDFGTPCRVEKVVYTPRNEVNFIYKDNLYELFCWDNGKWNSLGQQVAVSDSLVYFAPKFALFYLRNHTTGKDERILNIKWKTMFLVSALYIDKKGMGRRISIILLFAAVTSLLSVVSVPDSGLLPSEMISQWGWFDKTCLLRPPAFCFHCCSIRLAYRSV